MRAVNITGLALVATAAALAVGPALPQMQSMGDAALHTFHQPYGVETFGAFRSIMMGGDFSPKVRLADVMAALPTTGVGALADALGEITIYDRELIVSYGYAPPADTSPASAALLAGASVDGWQRVPGASGGERIHSHWVSLDTTKTAHLDRWGLMAGAFLLIPKPQ